MAEHGGPAIGRRKLGTALRGYRIAAGHTMAHIADQLGCSVGKISRLETALVPPNLADVRTLVDLYGLGAEEGDRLLGLAGQAREKAWWSSYLDVVPADSATFFGLEDGAATICEYSAGILPGLLQTPAHIHAVMAGAADAEPTLSERRVELRLRRQQVLRRARPPALHCVLDEAALHRTVGGRRARLAQLMHLLEMVELPNVTIQVLPLDAAEHPQLGSRFSILRFADPTDPQVVYLEEPGRNTFLDSAGHLDHFTEAFRTVCELSLSPSASTELIMEMVGGDPAGVRHRTPRPAPLARTPATPRR